MSRILILRVKLQKTYKDHKATILSWFYKDQGTKKADKPSNIPTWEEYDKGEHL